MISSDFFLKLFALINFVLLTSYVILRVTKDDFGDVPETLHQYMLMSAALAYAINIWHVLKITTSNRMTTEFQIATLSYYFLQLFFVPLVRLGNGNMVRLLLFVCIFPIAYLYQMSIQGEKMLSLYVLLHVLVNDFGMYGFMFDGSLVSY